MEIEEILEFAKNNNVPILRDESRNLLCSIIKQKNPKTILEFGTAIGFSAILMLCSTNSSKLDTIELDVNRANIAKENLNKFGLKERANVLIGDALEISSQLVFECKTYDFIFLDSSKAQYIKLLPNILKLLNSGGILVADNVLFRGYVQANDFPKRYKTIVHRLRDFIETCKNSDELIDVKVLDVEDGILIATKK